MHAHDQELRVIVRRRWRIALALTAVMLVVYFGFVLLTALAKELMGRQIVPGLSVGILLGAGVIVAAFALTGVYVRWANAHHDPALKAYAARSAAPAREDVS
jgi:uncharacterized membrane protein (DUF485 family)